MTLTTTNTKKIGNTINGTSLNTNNNQFRNRTITPRSSTHHQLPLSSTNATTVTLNGGSKTTISMASATKMPPIPTQRRSLIPQPRTYCSSNPITVNTGIKDQNSLSKPTCCFFQRKSKQDLQVT